MSLVLRDYQVAAINGIRELYRAGQRRVVLIAPTGSGKTVCFSSMVRDTVARGRRAMVVVHRKELVEQTYEKVASFGVTAGVIMGSDRRRDDLLPTQICTIQTLARRLDRLPPANFIIFDEAHLSASESYKDVLARYPNAYVLGATATPWRSDRIGLADYYDAHVVAATPAELIASGALVPFTAFSYDSPDLHKVKITAGEYNSKDLALAVNTKVIVGDIVKEYHQHGENRRAIVFAVNIAHSEHLVAEFKTAGFRAAHVDCDTPKDERKKILAAFTRGDIRVLCSVAIFTTGWDCPPAEICILARPTKSLTLLLQMCGRVLRPCPETGKTSAMLQDHGGNLLRHGLPDDERDYSLTATPEHVAALHICPSCSQVFSSTRKGRCPKCNEVIEVYEPRESSGDRHEHELVAGVRISRAEIEKIRARRGGIEKARELSDQQIARAIAASREQKVAEYLRLKDVAERKGFNKGFIAHQFRNVFAHWPKFTEEEIASGSPAQRPFFPLEKRPSP